MQADEQSRIVDAIVTACRDTAAHPNGGTRLGRAQVDSLPDTLNAMKIIVAPDQDMTVGRSPRDAGTAALFRDLRRPPAKPLTADQPEQFVERLLLPIGVPVDLVDQQGMDGADLAGTGFGKGQWGRFGPPCRQGKTWAALPDENANIIVTARQIKYGGIDVTHTIKR